MFNLYPERESSVAPPDISPMETTIEAVTPKPDGVPVAPVGAPGAERFDSELR